MYFYFILIFFCDNRNFYGTIKLYNKCLMCHGCFSLQILIEGMIGSSYKGDISIDDISFTPECQPEIGKLLVTGYYQFMNNIFHELL